ncbi:transposon Tf2-6 polyprotein [Trichonephila clavata]|uniref:Transposon Tf2-6 polyprotein n=1 Tax=Trichonephila clavata TaxID=2740835 RepID=A0A8X6LEV4_TRICU|nr:transposon Tf2-6 polyprotein [Trichonephila clavata]
MDENNEMAVANSNEQRFEANKVSVKIPPFWEEKPEIWFFQVEAQFSIANINQEETKFNYLVAQLDPKFIENIWDIIQIGCQCTFKESEEKSIKKLPTGISLGDMKPSQLLRKMKSLAGDNITEKVLRTLWLDKLPDSIKNILVVSSENLENLSVMADKIFEINSSREIYSATADNSAMKNILEKEDSNVVGLRVEPKDDLVCDSEKLVLYGGLQPEAVLDIRDDMVPITGIYDAGS